MTNEQKILLKLLNTSINGADQKLPDTETDWSKVAEEARQQAVLVMAFDATAGIKDNIPDDVYKKWQSKVFGSFSLNTRAEASQKELVELLERNKIPYVILKGEASAHYYPNPDLRALGDVDFLIDPTQEKQVTELLCENGYTSKMEDHACHTVFKKSYAHLEMHREIPGIPYGTQGEKIRGFISNAVSNGVRRDGFNAPSDCHHGLILLLHTQHHMVAEGIGLRHLCDWACFVKRTENEPFWEETLLPFLAEIGLTTFATVLTKTCADAFGISCPLWTQGADADLCSQLLEDVFSGGNFGTKDSNRTRTGMLITNRGKDGFKQNKYKRMLDILKRNIQRQHPSVKRYPILYPFFLVGKAVRYLALWIMGKRPSVNKLSADVDKRKSVYEQLQIFEVKKDER